jgi:hypothetical protein
VFEGAKLKRNGTVAADMRAGTGWAKPARRPKAHAASGRKTVPRTVTILKATA